MSRRKQRSHVDRVMKNDVKESSERMDFKGDCKCIIYRRFFFSLATTTPFGCYNSVYYRNKVFLTLFLHFRYAFPICRSRAINWGQLQCQRRNDVHKQRTQSSPLQSKCRDKSTESENGFTRRGLFQMAV